MDLLFIRKSEQAGELANVTYAQMTRLRNEDKAVFAVNIRWRIRIRIRIASIKG